MLQPFVSVLQGTPHLTQAMQHSLCVSSRTNLLSSFRPVVGSDGNRCPRQHHRPNCKHVFFVPLPLTLCWNQMVCSCKEENSNFLQSDSKQVQSMDILITNLVTTTRSSIVSFDFPAIDKVNVRPSLDVLAIAFNSCTTTVGPIGLDISV